MVCCWLLLLLYQEVWSITTLFQVTSRSSVKNVPTVLFLVIWIKSDSSSVCSTIQQGYESRWNLCTCLDWLWECLCCSRRGWSSNVGIPHCCSFIPRVIWTRTSSSLLVENNIIFLHCVVIEECMFLAHYVLLSGCLCSKKIF